MPRPLPRQPTAPVWPDEPRLSWTSRLDDFMWVDEFNVLYLGLFVTKACPMGADVTGILKPAPDVVVDRAQRRHYLDVLEQILELFTEFGVRHRQHPEFEIGGRVERGPQLLTGELLEPDQLIPECKVKFRLSLEEANRHD